MSRNPMQAPLPLSNWQEWELIAAVLLADLALVALYVVFFLNSGPERSILVGMMIPFVGIHLTVRALIEINRFPSAIPF